MAPRSAYIYRAAAKTRDETHSAVGFFVPATTSSGKPFPATAGHRAEGRSGRQAGLIPWVRGGSLPIGRAAGGRLFEL